MKNIFIISLIVVLTLYNFKLQAQSDEYDWSFKFGWSIPSFRNFGDTKEWVDKGKGNELILASLGYKNIHLNLQYKYFFGLKSENIIIFNNYEFPTTADYRQVFMNFTFSYEYELTSRLFIEPQIGWVRTQITSNVIDSDGNEIVLNNADGLIIGSNLTKYIKLFGDNYVGIFININYNFINYKTISNDLGGNTLGYGFGFVLKGTN